MSKHLSLEEREAISYILNANKSFKAIGQALGRDCTTISKEVRSHIKTSRVGMPGRPYNNCRHRFNCSKNMLCPNCMKRRMPTRTLSANPTRESVLRKMKLKNWTCSYHLFWRKDSLYIIFTQTNQDEIMVSESTIYRLVDYSLFEARNIDLPRKVRYAKRMQKKQFKIDNFCRTHRTYEDFEYSCAAEPPVQYRLSHLSRRSEPLIKHTICMMRVYSRNALSNPYTSRIEMSCSASMLVMLIR